MRGPNNWTVPFEQIASDIQVPGSLANPSVFPPGFTAPSQQTVQIPTVNIPARPPPSPPSLVNQPNLTLIVLLEFFQKRIDAAKEKYGLAIAAYAQAAVSNAAAASVAAQTAQFYQQQTDSLNAFAANVNALTAALQGPANVPAPAAPATQDSDFGVLQYQTMGAGSSPAPAAPRAQDSDFGVLQYQTMGAGSSPAPIPRTPPPLPGPQSPPYSVPPYNVPPPSVAPPAAPDPFAPTAPLPMPLPTLPPQQTAPLPSNLPDVPWVPEAPGPFQAAPWGPAAGWGATLGQIGSSVVAATSPPPPPPPPSPPAP